MLPAPLSAKLYKLAKCHPYLKLNGNGRFSKAFVRTGDYSNITLQNEFETEDVFGNDGPTRTLRAKWLVQKSGVLNQGWRQISDLGHAIIFGGSPDSFYTQAAQAAGGSFLTDEIGQDEAAVLPFLDGEVTAVMSLDAVPIAYVENQHYTFDPASGIFDIRKHPDGVVVDADGRAAVEITYGAPAITAADKVLHAGIMQLDDGLVGAAMFNQVGKGENLRITCHQVTFLNTEEVPIGSDENSPVAISVNGTLSEDPSKAEGFRWGEILKLKRA
ncbi:hypothetical protein [Devosia nitrariae]|uniref:Uncharacterized protein n=1 Tax=Devosia nitrariae TaxID=2071872 RepID=A0ABQ5W184_9HYPH|nr:hypothetical protein [Devosia nitrariae]GLQ53598.1 hypothetical protein GCM10010862_08570 [Devosia nitrariae]